MAIGPITPAEIEHRWRNQLDISYRLAKTLEIAITDAVEPLAIMKVAMFCLRDARDNPESDAYLKYGPSLLGQEAMQVLKDDPSLWSHLENFELEASAELFNAPDSSVVSWARRQRSHLTGPKGHMRQPEITGLPEPLIKAGWLIDSTLLTMCNIIDLWADIANIHAAKRGRIYRERQAQERERLRKERIEQQARRRLITMVEAERAAAQPTHEKREKHEVVRCAKCSKRPPTHGSLCDPCFEWEQRMLGRT